MSNAGRLVREWRHRRRASRDALARAGGVAFLPARLRSPYGTLTFLPAVTTLPTALAASRAELTVIALHPADARTRSAARAAASRRAGR